MSLLKIIRVRTFRNTVRGYAECVQGSNKKGLVLGVYDGCEPGEVKFTQTAEKYNCDTNGKLKELLKGSTLRKGRVEIFTNLCGDFSAVAVAGLGPEDVGYNSHESLDECKENIRIAAGVGAKAIRDIGVYNIFVEGFTNTEAAAEGATLACWKYQEQKARSEQTPTVKLELYEDPDRDGWDRGAVKAEAQNLARKLEETPANLMTPTLFAQHAINGLCACGVQVEVRDRNWIEMKRMMAFLTIAKSSCETPLFLEMGYCGADPAEPPVVLIGKGVTFDSGGLCLKKCDGMDENRADMAGAAVVVAVFRAVASINLPINITGLIPLCENMPGGLSVKPGDVVKALNGKTIRIEDTDNEGRIIMPDAIYYSKAFNPCLIMTIGTLTSEMRKALGSSSTGVFSTSEAAWRELNRAGAETGDRVWRFPFWDHYTKKVTNYIGVDVNNVGKGVGGGPCLSAAFLREFVPPGTDFIHMDITGTGMKGAGVGSPYLEPGVMTGRPTRTITQFLYQMSCPHDKGEEC